MCLLVSVRKEMSDESSLIKFAFLNHSRKTENTQLYVNSAIQHLLRRPHPKKYDKYIGYQKRLHTARPLNNQV